MEGKELELQLSTFPHTGRSGQLDVHPGRRSQQSQGDIEEGSSEGRIPGRSTQTGELVPVFD